MVLTWKKTLAVWWSVCWRGALVGVLLGGLFGGVMGAILGAQGYPPERIQVFAALAGYVASIIASFIAFKLGLQKHLASLVAGEGLVAAEPTEKTFSEP
ncbi:hypothetical protein [Paludisphaera sp.]|uniref:hypothetical protein n=1 Tax=Paludisphaera sp. TaxID=2017432 RepID=UPI00301D3961